MFAILLKHHMLNIELIWFDMFYSFSYKVDKN